MSLVVDTNVFAVSEGMHGGASEECVAACTRLLLRIEGGEPLLVDEAGEILAEYVGTLRSARTSGFAAKLAIRLYCTRHGGSCQSVAITPIDEPPGSYVEVPAPLRDFDTDDQKFIAVAAVGAAPIVAGLDAEWFHRRGDFAACAIDVQFACLADLL